MNVKSYNTLLTEMISSMASNQSKITDFNEGSVIYTIFEAVSRVLEKEYMDTRNGYQSNLNAVALSLFDFQKKSGTLASVKVKFSRTTAGTTDLVIGSSVKVSAGDYQFITTESATIEAGQTESNEVSASAVEVGAAYNVASGAINTIDSIVPVEVVSVTNTSKAENGSDSETDSETLARFKTYINGLQGNNIYGLKAGILAIDGVRSVSVQEHFTDLPEGIYNATVYVDDGTGSLSDTIKTEVQDAIEGDDNTPGLRAAGINVRVQSVTPVKIKIKTTCKVYRTDSDKATSEITDVLKTAINNLTVNEDVVWTSLILKLRGISYVRDVPELKLITIDDEGEETETTSNISIAINQIARFDSAEITVESAS